MKGSKRAWLELEVDLYTQAGDRLWKSARLHVDFQRGPTSLITDVSAAAIAGTIFNALGRAFGADPIALPDHPAIQPVSYPVRGRGGR